MTSRHRPLKRACARARAAAALAAAFAAGVLCGPAAHAAGSVTFCAQSSPEGFDVAQYETVGTNDASGIPLYDTLLQMKPGTTTVEPGIAERWEVSADGRVVTLHLRRGVKFHTTPWFTPTRDLNADDVLWSLNRINDPRHPGHAAAQAGYPYWAGMSMPALLQSAEKVDELTVRLRLTRAEAPLIANLTMTSIASVYSAEYAAQLLKAGKLAQINTLPVGTGPFVFKSYQKDAVVRYAANAAYWGGAPKADLIFAITPDPSVRVQRLKAGECLVGEVGGDNVASFSGDPRIAILRSKPLSTSYLAPNHTHPFLSDKRFREALSLAVDRASIVQSVYGGQATAAGSFLPPGIWSHDAGIKNPTDIERAKQLVKASGYDGRELTLFATARSSDIKRAVELLQGDWARIGVKVSPQLMELGELYKRTAKGDHDLALLSWFSDNGDPDNFFTPNLSCAAVDGGNKSRWCHRPFDALLTRARTTVDLKERTDLYVQAQRMIHTETALIPLANKLQLFAVHQRAKGFIATPFGGSDFRFTRLD